MSRPQKGRPDRDMMLAAAEELFSERGFGASSLRDVIGAMKCSTTAFYARFGSKDEVFEVLVNDLIECLRDRAATALSSVHGVEEGFEAGTLVLVETLIPRKALLGVALSEGTAIEGVRNVLATNFGALATLLEAQFMLIGVQDAGARAWALVGAIHMQVQRWAVFGEIADADLADAVRNVAQPFARR